MNANVTKITPEQFQVQADFDTDPPIARLIIDTDYYEEDEDGKVGEYAYSESWHHAPLVLPIKRIDETHVAEALREAEKQFIIEDKSYELIEAWLKDDPTEEPLSLSFDRYESYKGWSGTQDGFDGYSELVARLQTLEEFIERENSNIISRFQRG